MKRKIFLTVACVAAVACNNDVAGLGPPSDPATETFAPSLGVNISQMTRTSDGVYYKDVAVGPSTADSVWSKTVSVKTNYAGYLKDGKLFDSGSATVFDLSAISVAGFRTGIMGMRVGGKRKIVVPSALAYDGQSIRNPDNTIKIPRQSTLIFDVEILAVTQATTKP